MRNCEFKMGTEKTSTSGLYRFADGIANLIHQRLPNKNANVLSNEGFGAERPSINTNHTCSLSVSALVPLFFRESAS